MWKAYRAAVAGVSHIKQNTPCQDATGFYRDADCSVVVLADGAGSAARSELGAEAVCSCAGEYLAGHFDRLYDKSRQAAAKAEFLGFILDQLTQLAAGSDCQVRDLASTVLAAAVKGRRYLVIHLGDGVVGCLRGNRIDVLSHPSNGEYSNETYFTTSSDAFDMMRLFRGGVGSISGFILMSDGPAAGLYDRRNKTLSQVNRRMIEQCAEAEEEEGSGMLSAFLADVMRQKTTDDCSIAILADPDLLYLPADRKEGNTERYGLDPSVSGTDKRIRQMDLILDALQMPRSRKELLYLLRNTGSPLFRQMKDKTLLRRLEALKEKGFLETENGKYKAVR